MKVKITILVVILFVLLQATITCPGKAAHVDAIKEAVTAYIEDAVTDKPDTNGTMTFFATLFTGKLSELFLDTKLEVKNYILFSVGQITFDGRTRTVSVGAFNHVFTYGKEDIARAVNKK